MRPWLKINTPKFQKENYGALGVIENFNELLGFDVKRIYFIYDLNELTSDRGFHAHKILKQYLIALNGSLEIFLDDGYTRQNIILNNPSHGLLISKPVWRELRNFSNDTVILVLASELYNPKDYIFDYEEFKQYVSQTI